MADLPALRVVERSFGYRLDASRNAAGHADRAIALLVAGDMPETRMPRIGARDWDEIPKLPDLLGDVLKPERWETAEPGPDAIKIGDGWKT